VCNPKYGFKTGSIKEAILWFKYACWEKGIGPNEFRNCFLSDIRDIMDIQTAINNKNMRQSEVNNLMRKIKW